jgi:hypothetical protein
LKSLTSEPIIITSSPDNSLKVIIIMLMMLKIFLKSCFIFL